jgi:hypothetical protein
VDLTRTLSRRRDAVVRVGCKLNLEASTCHAPSGDSRRCYVRPPLGHLRRIPPVAPSVPKASESHGRRRLRGGATMLALGEEDASDGARASSAYAIAK